MKAESLGMKDKIAQQIAKMENRTVENGCTEAEASAAMETIGRLLTEHNLTMAEVRAKTKSVEEAEEVIEAYITNEFQACGSIKHAVFKASYRWLLDLGVAIGDMCFCKTTYSALASTIYYAGQPYDVEVAVKLYPWMRDQLLRVAGYEHSKLKIGDLQLMVKKDIWYESFLVGCVTRLKERVREEEKRRQEDPNTYAIVVDKAALIKAWWDKQFPPAPPPTDEQRAEWEKQSKKLSKKARRETTLPTLQLNQDAYEAGYKKADDIPLYEQKEIV